jgi:hypothetical protein
MSSAIVTHTDSSAPHRALDIHAANHEPVNIQSHERSISSEGIEVRLHQSEDANRRILGKEMDRTIQRRRLIITRDDQCDGIGLAPACDGVFETPPGSIRRPEKILQWRFVNDD